MRSIDLLISKRPFIRLNGHTKKGTILCEDVSWEMLGLRERMPGETVHVRTQATVSHTTQCEVCGVRGGIWVENISTHASHRDKCGG
jgi:hypothetical protein